MKPENWAAIRLSYEYDPDQPSMVVAAKRAAEKFGFKSPASSTIAYRMKKDSANGNSWERYGEMKGINAAAHCKADSLMLSKESSEESSDLEGKKLTTISADVSKMTDEQLQDILNGKMPR